MAMTPGILAMNPFRKTVVWGSDRLEHWGKGPSEKLGETWEVSCEAEGPSSDAASGERLLDIIARDPVHWLGERKTAEDFPWLVKLLATNCWLSLQVHPDDDQALELEGVRKGKRECWLVLEAAPGAELILGLNEGLGAEDLHGALRAGTTEAFNRILRRVPARVGDLFDIEPGTLHAIGPGLVILEVQQPSDYTYRVFDWERLGLDNKPRSLHVEQSLKVMNAEHRPSPVEPVGPSELMFGAALIDHEHFRLERWQGTGRHRVPVEGPMAIVCLGGAGDLETAGSPAVWMKKGRSFVVPQAVRFLELRGESMDLAVVRPPSRTCS